MIPIFARYEYCINKSIEFLLSENINRFPFDCDNIIKKRKWAKIKYTSLSDECGVSINDVIETLGSEDGFTTYNGRNYTISYNDSHRVKKRIYFTKLHEIGHICLGHFTEFNETKINRSNLTESDYKVLENEANCFARNVIAPAVIVKELNLNTPNMISEYFGITLSAARARLDLLEKDLQYINETNKTELLRLFSENLYKRSCSRCLHKLDSNNSKYCPICGTDELILGEGIMHYNSIEIYENSKTKICPICENENTDVIGEYCQICGTHIVNRCTDKCSCGVLLTGEARYCNHCGEKSTFYENDFLSSWEKC